MVVLLQAEGVRIVAVVLDARRGRLRALDARVPRISPDDPARVVRGTVKGLDITGGLPLHEDQVAVHVVLGRRAKVRVCFLHRAVEFVGYCGRDGGELPELGTTARGRGRHVEGRDGGETVRDGRRGRAVAVERGPRADGRAGDAAGAETIAVFGAWIAAIDGRRCGSRLWRWGG